VLLPRCTQHGAAGCLNEHIKRSDVVGRVFLLGRCVALMDDEMIGLIAAFMLYQFDAHWVWWVFFGVLALGEWCEELQKRGMK
jgi:hypothetical protein